MKQGLTIDLKVSKGAGSRFTRLKKSIRRLSQIPICRWSHFLYTIKVKMFYKNRDALPDGLEQAIAACEQLIAIAPKAARQFKKESSKGFIPSNVGFEQLVIIKVKQGEHTEALRLSEQALKQGWQGDWQKRIDKLKKKTS